MSDQAGSPANEEWFLGQLGQNPIPTATLLDHVVRLRGREADQADALAEMLQEALLERGLRDPALGVMQARASWVGTDTATRWKDAALRAFESSRDLRGLVDQAGFDKALPPAECFRRLSLLLALQPGVLCLDRTWGFGVVRKVDLYYNRIEIDFDRKPRHSMTLAYAAETLQLLDADHLLARAHREPETMKTLVQEHPGEVVRMALRSYGPLTAAQLQEKLVPRFVLEAEWKTFWDGARRELKKDALVEIPAKRSEPLRLLSKEKSFDTSWFGSLAAERDMARVLEKVDQLAEDASVLADESFRKIVGERLAFVIKGAGRQHPALFARAVMAARELKVDPAQVDAASFVSAFLQPERFLEITRSLPARLVEPFVKFLASVDAAKAVETLLGSFLQLNLTTLNTAVEFLAEQGLEERCAEIFRKAFAAQETGVELVYWVSRNTDRLEKWSLGSMTLLGHLMMIEIEKDYNGERLKVQNQLRARFEQPEMLKAILVSMTDLQRREMVERIRESTAWPSLDRRSLLGQIVKLQPDLQEALVARSEESAGPAKRGPLTSNRSYRQRQALLEKIVKIDIPQNSKEIAIARSYGDLSENHEFKAAKEMQGILLRRRGELELMLHNVTPSDFADLPHDRVGLGTGVVLRYADGREERFYILGEWDQDGALGIISCETRMAKALEGRKAGETVTVPTETGEVSCVLADVTGLSPEVKAWIDAEAAPAAES